VHFGVYLAYIGLPRPDIIVYVAKVYSKTLSKPLVNVLSDRSIFLVWPYVNYISKFYT